MSSGKDGQNLFYCIIAWTRIFVTCILLDFEAKSMVFSPSILYNMDTNTGHGRRNMVFLSQGVCDQDEDIKPPIAVSILQQEASFFIVPLSEDQSNQQLATSNR